MATDTLVAGDLRRIAAHLADAGRKIDARKLLYAANLLDGRG